MEVVIGIFSTLAGALWTLMGLPTFWCVVFVFLFESFIVMCDTLLKLVGCVLQQIVFGELRVHDENAGKDRIWNFIFYKFIFIFAVLNVSKPELIASWTVWFVVLGLVHLLTQLCQDRFDYISVSSHLRKSTHVRIVSLMSCLTFVCLLLHVAAIRASRGQGFNYFLLIDAEVVLVTLKIVYISIRYCFYLWEMVGDRVSERRVELAYQIDLGYNLTRLLVEFLHDLHVLVWGNVLLSMASIVIAMRIHSTFTELKQRLTKHRHYKKISALLIGRFPTAGAIQLEDPCAICWETMISARALPCQHVFHESCLRSWLEQDTSCPKCRLQLEMETRKEKPLLSPPASLELPTPPENVIFQSAQTGSQHVFQFNGSRLISWLPSVSLEVFHTTVQQHDETTTNVQIAVNPPPVVH